LFVRERRECKEDYTTSDNSMCDDRSRSEVNLQDYLY